MLLVLHHIEVMGMYPWSVLNNYYYANDFISPVATHGHVAVQLKADRRLHG